MHEDGDCDVNEYRRIRAESMAEKELQEHVRKIAIQAQWMLYHTFDSRRSQPGFPDLVLLKGHRQVVMELKREGKHPTIMQLEWLNAFQDVGAECYWFTPSDLLNGKIHDVLGATA